MKKKDTLITKTDRQRLDSVIKEAKRSSKEQLPNLKELQKHVRNARVVQPKNIPRNVVTMNSVVELKDTQTGHRFTFRLAYPAQARKFGRISVARAVGRALLGKH